MEAETTGILIGSGTVGAICGVLGSWIKARYSKTTVEPNPIPCKKDEDQAKWESNEHEHGEIFGRLRKLEADVAGHSQAILAMRDMQNRIYDMVTKLYERICEGKRGVR